MKIIIAADHAGLDYKNILLKDLQQSGFEIIDIDNVPEEGDDYPDRASDLVKAMASQHALEKLGKYKIGKGCLYVTKLADINLEILNDIFLQGMAKTHAAKL